jgi:CheY-like chemotaxis protein
VLGFLLGSSESYMNPTEVLLIEDNAGDTLLIAQALAESLISVHLRVARDGQQALQMLGELGFQPDLIILDLDLPKLSGQSVLAFCVNKTPVVVFTDSLNEADHQNAMSLGAKAFIHKPMGLVDYKTAVCRIVRDWAVPKDGGPAVLGLEG